MEKNVEKIQVFGIKKILKFVKKNVKNGLTSIEKSLNLSVYQKHFYEMLVIFR